MPKRRPWLTQLYNVKRAENGEEIDRGMAVIVSEIDTLLEAENFAALELLLKEVDLTRLNTAFVVGFCTFSWVGRSALKRRYEFMQRVNAELKSRPEMKGHVNALLKSLK